MSKKINCWQFWICGREIGGINVDKLGICPAARNLKYDGVNSGDYSGRFCWAVSGTLCDAKVQGTFANKIGDCLKCPFFLDVEMQEGTNIIFIKEDIKFP